MAETAAERYERTWANILDDRIVRGMDQRSEERILREFVDDPQGDYMDNVTPADPEHEDHTV